MSHGELRVKSSCRSVTGYASAIAWVVFAITLLLTAQQMKDGWGMAPLPLYQGKSTMPYWLGGWVIPKDSAAITAAQSFAIWRATEFQDQMAADHDWIPIANAARESEAMLKGMPDGFKEAMAGLATAQIGDIYTSNTQKILDQVFGPNFDELFRNKKSAQDTAQAIQDGGTALL